MLMKTTKMFPVGELVVVEGSRTLARVVRDDGGRWVELEDRGEGPGRRWEVQRDRLRRAW
jgi:hypothetical protein